MVDRFSDIGYVTLINNTDISICITLVHNLTNNLATLPLVNEIKPKDNTTFNIIKSTALLVSPLSL